MGKEVGEEEWNHWKLESVDEEWFYLQNVESGMYLDCNAGEPVMDNKSKVQAWWDRDGTKGPLPECIQWRCEQVDGIPDHIYIVNKRKGGCLDSHGTSVWLWHGMRGSGGPDDTSLQWIRSEVSRT